MSSLRRIANLFRRTRIDREIDEELQAHIDLSTDAKKRQGLPDAVARREAVVRFGNPVSTRERTASADVAFTLESMVRDVRFAFRQLVRAPGFTLTAVLTLAVAIGANAVVFSILNALVLRPLDLPDGQRL